jgi:CheY-like chemotaxis protein
MAERKRILVVDDETEIRELLRRILEGAGYEVVFAADGFEALGKVHLDPPDLVLLDLMMPGMDGWQALAALRAMPASERPRVVVVSALRGAQEQALQAGAQAFVPKPFRFAVLLATCKDVLRAAPNPD